MKKLFLLATLFFMAVFSTAQAADTQDVKVTDAWMRVSPNKVAGAFFEIKNTGDKPLKLVAATTQGAQKTELHNHLLIDGVMKMRKIDFVELPANSNVSFNTHGYHLMMFKLDQQVIKIDNMIKVELTFDDGSTKSASFMVKPFGKGGKKMDHSKMKKKK